MRFSIPLSLAVGAALAGCSATAQRQIAAERACTQEAGPAPGNGLPLLGLLGAAIQVSQPAWQTWARGVADCKRQRLASTDQQ